MNQSIFHERHCRCRSSCLWPELDQSSFCLFRLLKKNLRECSLVSEYTINIFYEGILWLKKNSTSVLTERTILKNKIIEKIKPLFLHSFLMYYVKCYSSEAGNSDVKTSNGISRRTKFHFEGMSPS